MGLPKKPFRKNGPLNTCMNYECDNRIKFITQRRKEYVPDDYCSGRCMPEWLRGEIKPVPPEVWKRSGEPL